MKGFAFVLICLAPAFVIGCNKQREERATRLVVGVKAQIPQIQPPTPSNATPKRTFHGIDLSLTSHTTRSSDLPDLWEERPKGSRSFEMREDVVCVYSGFDGSVYHIPSKNCFYIQSDPLASSTLTYYGPFEGNPVKILKLDAAKAAEQSRPAA